MANKDKKLMAKLKKNRAAADADAAAMNRWAKDGFQTENEFAFHNSVDEYCGNAPRPTRRGAVAYDG
jgi:hypothetical protein